MFSETKKIKGSCSLPNIIYYLDYLEKLKLFQKFKTEEVSIMHEKVMNEMLQHQFNIIIYADVKCILKEVNLVF